MSGASLRERGLAWAGRQLGVPAGAPAGVWLHRLFVLPRPAPVAGTGEGPGPLARGLGALQRLGAGLGRGLGRRCRPLGRLGQAGKTVPMQKKH